MSWRLLLVEDNPMDATLAKAALSSHHITHVTTLAGAIDAMGQQNYDLVLLDISLPDAEGTFGIRALRAAGAPSVIMLSGNLDPDLEQAVQHFGAASFFVKGFTDEDELEAAIEDACAQKPLPRADSGLLNADGLKTHAVVMEPVSVVVLRLEPEIPELITLLGEKLARVVPATCTLGQVGPSEFAMLLDGSTAGDQMAGMACDHMQRPVPFDGDVVTPTCVLAVATWSGDGEDSLAQARQIAATGLRN